MTRTIQWNVVAYMICALFVTTVILSFTFTNALWNSQIAGLSAPHWLQNKAVSSPSSLSLTTEAMHIPKSLFQPATVIPKASAPEAPEQIRNIPVPSVPVTVVPMVNLIHTYKVTAFYLNVRSMPDASSTIMTQVKQGELLKVVSVTESGWLSLQDGGYVHGGYAEKVPQLSESISVTPAVAAKEVKAAKVEVSTASVIHQTVKKVNATTAAMDNLPIKKKLVTSLETLAKPTSKVMSDSGLNKEQIATIFKGTKLAGHGLEAAVLAIEDKYGINAFFTIAVMKLESGNGSSRLAQTKNNLFGLNAVTGKNAYKKAFSFATKGESVRKFGQLLSANYVERGYTTIEKVAKKYCPANGRWAGHVRSIMRSDFLKLA
ncbi:SH3 domain-containing protein [Paenibacillus sp. CF384]|uniref:SH3 domain-containing protein n=1 Tax=Paenibacillus sp. CF384 TaxID=1884382 RepID=UPI00089AEDC7|nr:glucosaminidase domain-containing protein [Paenibacillus sp. CF384]SDW13051.1 SH3 domain-containing protein [Paenibacillus sp. CF384]